MADRRTSFYFISPFRQHQTALGKGSERTHNNFESRAQFTFLSLQPYNKVEMLSAFEKQLSLLATLRQ